MDDKNVIGVKHFCWLLLLLLRSINKYIWISLPMARCIFTYISEIVAKQDTRSEINLAQFRIPVFEEVYKREGKWVLLTILKGSSLITLAGSLR